MAITTILIVITVFSSLATIVLTLMQTSKGDMGSAFGGGGSQSMFGSRGSANFLSRSTSVMITVFFVSSILLAYFYAQRDREASIVDNSVIQVEESDLPALGDDLPTPDASVDDGLSVDEASLPTLEDIDGESAAGDLEVPEIPATETLESEPNSGQ